MKKVLLIGYHNPNQIGLRTISSLIKESGRYEVSQLYILEFSRDGVLSRSMLKRDYISRIAAFSASFDYVMFSSSSYDKEFTFAISDAVKKRDNSIKIIIGGSIGLGNTDECLEHADYVCVLYGDNIVSLLDSLETHEPGRLPNFASKENRAPSFENLAMDSIPIPDYSTDNNYFFVSGKIVRKSGYSFSRYMIETARGCAYNCTFCSSSTQNVFKRKEKIPLVAKGAIDVVISKLKDMKRSKTGDVPLFIVDDNFFSYSLDEIREFSKRYKEHINIPFSMHVDPRSKEIIDKFSELLKQDVPFALYIGVQSGSDSLNREEYDRYQSSKEIISNHKKMMQMIKKSGKHVELHYYIIYCNPLEKKQDLIDTINMMLEMHGGIFEMRAYSPIPNTQMGDKVISHYEELNTFWGGHKKTFYRFFSYYAFYFIINRLNRFHFSHLLPKKITNTFTFDLLNSIVLLPNLAYSYLEIKSNIEFRNLNREMFRLIFD
jgi:radical SAM superfamily enzyme YgiQ (UPF0313 family)